MTRALCLFLFAVSLLFAPTPAQAAPVLRKWSVLESSTQAAPTSATVGMDLSQVKKYRVNVKLASGNLTGSEMLVPYVYSPALGAWVPIHNNVLTVTQKSGVTFTGLYGWEDLPGDIVPFGRVYYAALGFGANVTVSIDAYVEQ